MDHRQPVLDRDVERAHDLLDRERIPGAALDGGIVGANDHLAPRNDADADDRARRRRLAAIGHVGGERGEFEKRRARIEQLFDPLARQHLALTREAVEIALRSQRVAPVSCFARNALASSAIVRRHWRGTPRSDVLIMDDDGASLRPRRAVRVPPRSRPCRMFRRRRAALARASRRAGRASVICSFMLSIVTRLSPRATASPGCLWTSTTLPGMGARTWSSSRAAGFGRVAGVEQVGLECAAGHSQDLAVADMRPDEAMSLAVDLDRLPAVVFLAGRRHLIFAAVDPQPQMRAAARRSPPVRDRRRDGW